MRQGKGQACWSEEQGVRWPLKCRSYLSPMWSSPLFRGLRIFFGDDPHAQTPPDSKPRAGGGTPIPHGGGGMPEHSGCRGAGGMSPETVSGSGWVVAAGCSLQHLEAKLQAGKKSLKPFLSWCLFKVFFQPLHLKQKQEYASGQLILSCPEQTGYYPEACHKRSSLSQIPILLLTTCCQLPL